MFYFINKLFLSEISYSLLQHVIVFILSNETLIFIYAMIYLMIYSAKCGGKMLENVKLK